ncbi:hypothetical protein VitviT2T_000719 [Vitis vinifera]|uniref:Amine oxidase domain-containing protein n=1 Tax=Vitis vinifera TaxID=29760 RepID=A0ABY9BDL4_VITVI|nr:hypothetical protein VitviT2T_000719 [Vitis vinifera]
MVIDYYLCDFEGAEPPRVNSLLNSEPSPTYSKFGVTVKTEDGLVFRADYVIVSVSLGVLQNDLIKFHPSLPHLEREFPGENVLLVSVTDDESRRLEQQSDSETREEIKAILRNMFGKQIPEATDILVPRWWSNRFYKGSYSNWPIGVGHHQFNQIKVVPFIRIYQHEISY